MKFITERYEMLRFRRSAIDRYALQSLLEDRLSDDPVRRITWTQTAAQNINTIRASGNDGLPPVSAGALNGLVLLSEAYLRVMSAYGETRASDYLDTTVDGLVKQLRNNLDRIFSVYLDGFPTRRIYHRAIDSSAYLSGKTAGVDNRIKTIENMIVSRLHQLNPAIKGYSDLVDPSFLSMHCNWNQFFTELDRLWDHLPPAGPGGESLIHFLRKPILESPDSIEGQLRYIANHWRHFLGDFTPVILQAADTIREETRPVFHGPGPALVPEYRSVENEPEAYSMDVDWMPNVVLLAKNTYVWLEQISREYNSRVDTLDKVPEEELERLAARGFNALWLIGLWSRSHASRRIKQMCGNPEAAASAYAIYDYRIDDDLGGEAAFEVLKHRAARYGIRMAGDMVPNHMGIDSWWVCEHPEWFIAAEHNPFPRYSYSGVDLSRDSKCSIFLEDHYYDRTDAAVTFKYVDHWNHRTLYIYHGNDGTDLPWNDTAQLNFLREDVREQVIRTIIDVARRFPIIRFDAAMTLARKHYHRLWFPEPGGGGDIPSRSRFGMSREAFDEQMPVEFWREVVDRIGREAPDTLLLAEAFWLMEGYFVRSLGMHRVYNSAFMNMLRDEDNQKYRSVIKNTIEFDPEILKRYVNFMNNPDEEPAALQFGRGEKYFGVCAMMCTLPGLPMFGHGQYEGYAEKYGMEYRRSYWNETVDTGLLTHHQRVITPILRRRAVFSGASSFRLFDMVAGDGGIDENVFAYANRHGDSRGLFIFNNASHPTEGTLRMSAAWNSKDGTDEGLQQEMLSESLQLTGRQDRFVLLHDLMSRRWFIRNSRTLHREGFFVQLSPYGCFVFVDIREVAETEDQRYSGLETHLGGGGCRDIEGALLDLKHQSLHDAFRSFFDDALIDSFREMTGGTGQQESDNHVTGESERLKPAGDMIDLDAFTDRLRPAVTTAIHAAAERGGPDPENCLEEFIDDLEELLPEMSAYRRTYPDETRVLILWFSLIVRLADRFGAGGGDKIDNARLWRLLEDGLAASGMSESMAGAAARLVNAYAAGSDSPDPVISVLQSEDGRRWIQAHRFRGTVYFNREAFEEFLEWMILWHRLTPEYRAAAMRHAEAAGFRLEELLDALSSDK